MKIQFVIEKPIRKIVSTWEEIKKNGGESFSKEFYLKCKALELNKDFEKEIIKSRKMLGIPENGYPFDYEITKTEIEKGGKEIGRLEKIFYFDRTIKNTLHDLLYENLVYYNMDVSDQDIISCRMDDYFGEYEEDNGVWSCVLLSITIPITRHRLKKYIDNNWKYIKDNLDKLPKRKDFNISEKQLRIFEIKESNKKLTYSDIANQIIKEFNIDDPEAKTNEESIKTEYNRAKKKIESLAKYKKK